MADTFFGFDTAINNGERIGSPEDVEVLETEEEYDALNDETFGALEETDLDDWEQQHEQFAEIAESSRHSDQIETSLNQLVLDESECTNSTTNNSVWSYNANSKDAQSLNSSILSSLQKTAKAFVESNKLELNKQNDSNLFNRTLIAPNLPQAIGQQPLQQLQNHIPKKVCTVEELERGLLNNRNKAPAPPHPQNQQPYHGFNMQQQSMPARLPPGLSPMGGIPPAIRHLPQMGQMPPGLMRLLPPPHFMPHGPPPPPGLIYPGNAQFPVNHPFNFPPPHQQQQHQQHRQQQQQQQQQQNAMYHNNNNAPHMHQQKQMQQHQQQQQHHHQQQQQQQQQQQHHLRQQQHIVQDEYAGLMNNREKQWLLNIQLIQLNTGTPYFDDYYYTVFKERQRSKGLNSKDGCILLPNKFGGGGGGNDGGNRGGNAGGRWNNGRERRGEQQEQQQQQHRVYTPLQFENSLGKLQCGSVTAPRKIIDMDIVTPDKDSEVTQTSRDTRKTKQLLLELEALYSLMLKAEDLRNPLAIANLDKLKELKQKQRLRELEVATTSEQKTDILRLLQQESLPSTESYLECLSKVINGLIQDEKLTSFLAIRKGKMLLLRLLSNIGPDTFGARQLELWTKVLLSIPVIGRRDTAGDNLLPQLHPHFKRFIQCRHMVDILEIVASLTEVIRPENARSTPLSHQGKAPLHFVVGNKLGISTVATMLTRTEYLVSSSNATVAQQADWSSFVVHLAETLQAVGGAFACPLESINVDIFNKHAVRIANLSADKRHVLDKAFVVDT